MNGLAQEFGPGLLVATLAAPLIVVAIFLAPHSRALARLLTPLAAAPALGAAALAIGGAPFGAELPALRVSLWLDRPGGLLLFAAALVWLIVSLFALGEGQGRPNADRFAVSWLLTMAGSLGVFIAADLLTFYLVYALVSVPAYYLVAHDEDPASRRAGGVYMAFALIGEAVLLIAFVMLAAGEPNGAIQIRDVVAALPHSPWRDAALALIIIGFGMKIALVPLHGWMPLTYTRGADPGRGGVERRRGQGGGHRPHPVFAPWRGLSRLGRSARLAWLHRRLLWRRDRRHPARSEDNARLFEHQPDGGDRRGARHGARERRPGRGDQRRVLCGEPRAGEGRLVPDIGRRRRARRARANAGPHRGGVARPQPCRIAAERRRAGQARGQGPVRRRRRGRRGATVRGRHHRAHAHVRHAPRALARGGSNRGAERTPLVMGGAGRRRLAHPLAHVRRRRESGRGA